MSRSPEERLSEVLADFRAREPAPATWLTEDGVLRVLRVWKTLPVRLSIPLTIGGTPMHAHNRWKYAWKFRALDVATLAAAAELSAEDAAASLDRLAAARFIYPDGTLSAAAEAAIRTY